MNKISTKHLMFFILATTIIALRSYSSIFIKLGGRDTALIAVIATIIYIFFLMFNLKIIKETDSLDLNETFNRTFPKFISITFLSMFIIGLFLASIESVAVEANSIHTNFFLSTPNWYCLLFLIVPAAFVLNKDIHTILILVIVTISMNFLGDIILLILTTPYLNFHFLLPILQNGINEDIIASFILILGSLSSVSIILPYLKFLNKKKGLITYSTIASIISSVLIVISLLYAITFFGPTRASNIFYPEYVEAQRVQIAHFFEFGEIFYIFRSVSMWFLKYILASYGILILLEKKIKNKSIFISIYSLIIFIICNILIKNQYNLFSSLEILQKTQLLALGAIPLLTFCILPFTNEKFTKKR